MIVELKAFTNFLMEKVVQVFQVKVTVITKNMKNKKTSSYSCLTRMNLSEIITKETINELSKSNLIYYMFLNQKFMKIKNRNLRNA